MHGQVRIESIFAWVCTDKDDGTEGVPAVQAGEHIVSLSTCRRDLAEAMRPTAERLQKEGHKMALVEFTARITHENLS